MDEGEQLPPPAAVRRHGAARSAQPTGAACSAAATSHPLPPRGLLGNVVPEGGVGVWVCGGGSPMAGPSMGLGPVTPSPVGDGGEEGGSGEDWPLTDGGGVGRAVIVAATSPQFSGCEGGGLAPTALRS